jgi:hypothetical protein
MNCCLILKCRLCVHTNHPGCVPLVCLSHSFKLNFLITVCCVLRLRAFEKKETNHLNENTVSASDFTLLVTGIPPSTKEAEVQYYS